MCYLVGCSSLISVIVTTEEAKIRKISVQRHLGQIVHETLSQKYPTQKWDLMKLLKWKSTCLVSAETLSSNPSKTKTTKSMLLNLHVLE
jgi:hypothetical protein